MRRTRANLPHTVHIEVEVDRLDQIPDLLNTGVVDTIMLDNFSLSDLRAGVALIDGAALVEASGGVTLQTISDIAETGVDIISVGALTHGVRSIDIGLDVTVTHSKAGSSVHHSNTNTKHSYLNRTIETPS